MLARALPRPGVVNFSWFHRQRRSAGVGVFNADGLVRNVTAGPLTVEERRRLSDIATNVGAGVLYRFNDWLGLTADYRSFFVHRDSQTPQVNRFTTGLAVTLR